MYNHWKYIVFEGGPQYLTPILFPPSIQHDDMARNFPKWKPISAGFVTIGIDAKPYCYGSSVSLRLDSKPEDASLLKKLIS